MLTTATLLFTLAGAQMVAQLPSPSPSATPLASPAAMDVLNSGPCMDSPRAVPAALQPPATRTQQILRIDKVVSTQTTLQNEVIGYLYTLQDGSTWLGQRTPDYMSAADARAINQLLSLAHAPDTMATEFPPTKRYGVSTHNAQFFKVALTTAALDVLHVRLDSCIAWPAGRPLPDPSM